MKILILETDYTSNQSTLSGATANHEAITISGDSYVYCDVTNQSVWNSVKATISSDNYAQSGTGILLPPGALGK